MEFKEVFNKDFSCNPFTVVGKEWLLITAEKNGIVNTLTASWGGFGHLWNKDVVNIFIRQSRYTKEFIDEADNFSISILNHDKYLDQLMYLGKVSGRDENKIKNSGLTIKHIDDVPYFMEANQVFICKKLFAQTINSNNIIDNKITDKFYENEDNHEIYFGEVIKILKK